MKVRMTALCMFMAIVILLSAAGCGQSVVGLAFSDKARDSAPNVSASELDTLVAGNSEFALDLYRALREESGNLFLSPYSISLALAMTYAGARGETERQMAETLRFLLVKDRLHPAFNALDLELAKRGEGAEGADGEGFRLNIVNAIWGQKDYRFLTEYLDTLAGNYGAGLRLMDFVGAPEPSREIINDWVMQQTEDRIKDLLPEGSIDALTRLVLTNAIYFNAAWLHPFQEEATRDGTFYLADGTEVTIPMMRQTESHGYVKGEGYEAVELLYDGRDLSMVILLPDKGRFAEFEGMLDAGMVRAVIDELGTRAVSLAMPKFEFESEFDLSETLQEMGMPAAFTGAADFSGITGGPDLMISKVLHKSFVAVDEAGTEAAAATAVIMRESAAVDPVEVTADRPFVFLIRDIDTGTILFLGRVMDPTA